MLEAAPLFGGVKVVLHQANVLVDRGHHVTVVCPQERPDWYPLKAHWHQTTGLDPHEIPSADVIVATFWTTLSRARAARAGEVVHFCQGFEGDLEHNTAEHPAILEAYASPVPAMTVSPHLAAMISRRFGRLAQVVPQPLEPWWRPRRRWAPRRPARVLATGPWEIYLKGVPIAAEAVRSLRARGVACRWIRLSQWPLCEEERGVLEPDEFHHHLPPEHVPALIRSCDLLLAPSWPVEGFGLPVLEAMACGVPSVVSDIPSFRGFAD
ncbi:MAG: glycosyltransferase family 4 protein, partial [Acidobacteriota bacterium]